MKKSLILQPLPVLAGLIATLLLIATSSAKAQSIADMTSGNSVRLKLALSGSGWQFTGGDVNASLPAIGSDAYRSANWTAVEVPHDFQKRGDMTTEQGWYRRTFTVPRGFAGRHLYLVFEGAAAIADVYVNGTHLGQHRGAYTRFIFDATAALRPGASNELAVQVDNRKQSTVDCLPNGNRLYTVWGGLYRRVWLIATHDLQIDPTFYASPGVFLSSTVAGQSAQLQARVLLLNSGSANKTATVKCTLFDPSGRAVVRFNGQASVGAGQKGSVTLSAPVPSPLLWTPKTPNVYHLRVLVSDGAQLSDSMVQPVGFRTLTWDFKAGTLQLNGQPITLYGADSHQETEKKGSAIAPGDLMPNYDALRDMGATFVRLPHYPHAEFEYDLCDQRGLFCWAENGHSNKDMPNPTADQITTEMVLQNFNHPSIALWSVGNEASSDVAEREVPVVRALDPSRAVMVANMRCANADYRAQNIYPGWYGKTDRSAFKPAGIISEIGAGGVVTSHTDYAAATHKVDIFEPEEWQQLVAETELEAAFRHNDGKLGIFTWWIVRDFNDIKYKRREAPFSQGINTKGLLTYGGDRKDVFYLYRCFGRPDAPTLHITSKRYFLRQGAVDNGIKVYSSAPAVTLTVDGQQVSTLQDGQYTQPDPSGLAHPMPIEHVFYWKVPLHTGKNEVLATDDRGDSDSATIYFEGANGLPELPAPKPLITNLASSNPANPAYFMDMPVQPQWPFYYDFDSAGDNSLDLIPPDAKGASWIALRRVTRQGQDTEVSFTVAKPSTVYVLCSAQPTAPADITGAGFKLRPSQGLSWRDDVMHLQPAELYSRAAARGDSIKLKLGERDALILVKPN